MALPRIALAEPIFDGNETRYVQECLDSGWVSSKGRFVSAFEDLFAEFCGVRHAIATCNGTSALHLALVGLGIGPGDEVIVPTLTYIATVNAVRYCGARPVLADCERNTFNIDPTAIAAKIGPRTRGIVVAHLYGHPVDMNPIRALAARHRLFVVEDAAEAHGAKYYGRPVGGLSDCAAFSFYGDKIITTGEGGMVTTNDDTLAGKLRLYRGQGMNPDRRYWFEVVGYNYRMSNVAAAIGLAQLERVGHRLDQRRDIAALYHKHLSRLADSVIPPATASWAQHAHWMYAVQLSDAVETGRDQVMATLDANDIETRPVFYPMHQLPPYAEAADGYPNANHRAARGIVLPMHGRLLPDDVTRICDELERAIRR
jgi:perosamine synthetase